MLEFPGMCVKMEILGYHAGPRTSGSVTWRSACLTNFLSGCLHTVVGNSGSIENHISSCSVSLELS